MDANFSLSEAQGALSLRSSVPSATNLDKVAKADEALGRIMNASPENTTLILTADHGGHTSIHGTTDRP